MLRVTAALLGGYLIGSIPFGLILTRMAGLGDIRAIGSGNIGATNVLRTGNRKVAAATLLLDGLKGAAAVLLARGAFGLYPGLLAGFAAVLGHMFPLWLRLRGGKGAATGFGVLFAVAWPAGLICSVVWIAVAKTTRLSSLAGLAMFALAPMLAVIFGGNAAGMLLLIVSLLIFWRHSGNIRRLVSGTEPRIGQVP